jgi:serine/threonine-protein kinase RsbW
MHDSPAVIRLPARMESLYPLTAFVVSCARRRGIGEKRTREIELVMEEILVNIFKYAYPDRPGQVEVACSRDDSGSLAVEIVDEGVPFNILTRADPELEAGIEDRQIGGLGVFFVKQLVPEIRYRREHGKNILTLTIDPASQPPVTP